LTGVHADTVVRQLALENKFIDQLDQSRSGRASNDNMLDIIASFRVTPTCHMASQVA